MTEQLWTRCNSCQGLAYLRERCEGCGGTGRVAAQRDKPTTSKYWPVGVEKSEPMEKGGDGRK